MPTLTVWRYDTAAGAGAAEVRLKVAAERKLLTVHDAITVTWMPADDKPVIGHVAHATASAAGKGSVLGALVGTLVLAPAVGAAAGASIGAVAQKLRGTGIDADVLANIREALRPGSSALLVLSSGEDVEAIEPLLHDDAVLVHAALDDDAPEALREALARRQHPEEPEPA
jgi:uncharacterized membrane protein